MRSMSLAVAPVLFVASIATIATATVADAQTRPAASAAAVPLIRSASPQWTSRTAWRIDAKPFVTIGVENGSPEYELDRVYSAMRMPDKTIVISNSGTSQVRIYKADGTFLTASGRSGGGPGEFAKFSTMRICRTAAGTIAAEDGVQNRINIYATTGKLVTSIPLVPQPKRQSPAIIACIADGTWLGIVPVESALGGAPGMVISFSTEIVRVNAGGAFQNSVAKLPSKKRFVNEVGEIIHYPYIPFWTEPVAAVSTKYIFVGTGQTPRIEKRAMNGNLLGAIEWNALGRARTKDVWGRFKAVSLEEMKDSKETTRKYTHLFAQPLPLPDSTPAYDAILVDSRDNVWVKRFNLPWDRELVWEVFNEAGRWQGSVTVPATFTLLQAGDDFVLGRNKDDLDVERVELYRLTKPGQAPPPQR